MQFIQPIPYTEALGKIGRKSLIASDLNSSQWSAVPLDLRERAFFSSQVESVRFLQRARDSITDFLAGNRETLPDGAIALKTGGRADFVKQMQDFLQAEGVTRTAGGLTDITSQKRLELIFDTQTRQAQDYGYWKQGQDPDVLDAFPAQRFIRVLDVKEPRDAHRDFEGAIALKSNLDFWIRINEDFGVPWGPWGWGCGHDVEDVDREEAEQMGIIAPGDRPAPAEKSFNDRLEASTKGLDDDLMQFLEDAFGDQIDLEPGHIRWKSSPTPTAPTIVPARQNPLSKSAILQLLHQKQKVQAALAAIDKSHDDGLLTPIPFTHRVSGRSQGTYYSRGEIGIRRKQPIHPELTTVHEAGHWLDDKALPGAGFSSVASPALDDWRRAVQGSKAYQHLVLKTGKYRDYLMKWEELWARSYAQYIAKRSDYTPLRLQVLKVREGKTPGHWPDSQWTEKDFEPISKSIDNLFRSLGWL
jgi:hypothetical protein